METPPPSEDKIEPTPPTEKISLSERELEILRLVVTGASNKQIAQQLTISANTVKVHLRNIFAKLGVASRTEATLHAIRDGWVQVPGMTLEAVTSQVAAGEISEETTDDVPTSEASSTTNTATPNVMTRLKTWRWWLGAGLSGGALILLSFLFAQTWNTAPPSPTPVITPTVLGLYPHLETSANLPTARSQFALVAYDNQIYAIGGSTATSVTAVLERYDLATNLWETLRPKPSPVSEVSAVVIGGHIYVPGGRLASGQVSDQLEVYNPHTDQWETRAPLPAARSAYALAAFEGKLYLFGGWDGTRYVATVYQYAPEQDQWLEQTAMPTARGFAGAAMVNNSLYILGGTDGQKLLDVNERYQVGLEGSDTTPWDTRHPAPEALTYVEAGSVIDIIYGVGERPSGEVRFWRYFTSSDAWETLTLEKPLDAQAELVPLGARLHLLGGQQATARSQQHFVYQAVLTAFLPVISSQNNP